jgi:hypothetical protein
MWTKAEEHVVKIEKNVAMWQQRQRKKRNDWIKKYNYLLRLWYFFNKNDCVQIRKVTK